MDNKALEIVKGCVDSLKYKNNHIELQNCLRKAVYGLIKDENYTKISKHVFDIYNKIATGENISQSKGGGYENEYENVDDLLEINNDVEDVTTPTLHDRLANLQGTQTGGNHTDIPIKTVETCVDGKILGKGAFGTVVAGIHKNKCVATKIFLVGQNSEDVLSSFKTEKETNDVIRTTNALRHTLVMDDSKDENMQLSLEQKKAVVKGFGKPSPGQKLQIKTIAYNTFPGLQSLADIQTPFSDTHIFEFINIAKEFLTYFVHTDIKPGNVMFYNETNKFYIIDIGDNAITEGYGYILPSMYTDMMVDVPENISNALMFMNVSDDEASYQYAIFAVLLTACQMTKELNIRKQIWDMVDVSDNGIAWKSETMVPDVAAAAGGGRPAGLLNAISIALSLCVVVASSFVPR